jgi:ribonuclease G
MVQLIKEPNGQKGARISTQITLAGRYLVYLPTSDHIGISRKIEDEADREKLKKLADQLRSPGEGLIIRTVALGRDEQELAGDLAVLKAKWQQIKKKYLKTPPGGAVYFDLTLGERLVRDFVKDNITAIVVNNNDLHEQISTLLNILSPGKLNNLKLVEEDLFFKYQLYDEIEAALQPKVWLKSGGYLVLNQTEALMVVDVNTGKFVGHKSLEDTVLRINLEAVTEACRQIRLRNVGGIIIIDLIDMKQDNHKQQVLELVGEEVKKDHMRVTILGLTNLGLVEMTRKKVRPSLANLLLVECDTCGGTGYVRKKENQGILDMNE